MLTLYLFAIFNSDELIVRRIVTTTLNTYFTGLLIIFWIPTVTIPSIPLFQWHTGSCLVFEWSNQICASVWKESHNFVIVRSSAIKSPMLFLCIRNRDDVMTLRSSDIRKFSRISARMKIKAKMTDFCQIYVPSTFDIRLAIPTVKAHEDVTQTSAYRWRRIARSDAIRLFCSKLLMTWQESLLNRT